MKLPTAGIILAAGLSSRFGANKLLAEVDGRPMLQHVLDLARVSGLAPVVVVLGTDADRLLARCSWRGEVVVRNSEPEAGLSSSVKLAFNKLGPADVQRAVVLLGDQPFLTRHQLTAVLGGEGKIVVPRYDGRIGNPVVIDRSAWPLAAQLEGDRGMVQVIATHPELVGYVDIAGTNPDVDTPEDLAALR